MEDIIQYYNDYNENDRLSENHSIERIRTQLIIERYLDNNNKAIIDIGGGTGVYSFWLANKGFKVDLVDFVPRHIDIAKEKNSKNNNKLNKIEVGDATNLSYADNTFDYALLFGPLYHILDRDSRIKAIKEASRVVKKDGYIFISYISKFASLVDGFKYDFVQDQQFITILDNDLLSGLHINNTEKPYYFMNTYFHSIDDIVSEINESGNKANKILGIEGFSVIIDAPEKKMNDKKYKEYLLKKIEETEEEKSIIGISSHIMAIIKKST